MYGNCPTSIARVWGWLRLSKLSSSPLLYLITDRHQYALNSHEQLEAIAAATQAGCQLIQIREKDLSTRSLCEFVRAAMQVAHRNGARVLVNDRLDVALATGADGIHLRTNSLPTSEIRRLVTTPHFLIGVSTHSLNEAQIAAASGASFVVCGPVFPTPSKAIYGEPMGLEIFAEICQRVTCPVLALGGITMSNFSHALNSGASGLAGISLFKNSHTLVSNIKIMLSSRLDPQD